MRVCLFEDRGALDLEPVTLTRPAFDLLCGMTSLAAKQSRFSPPGPRGVLVRPGLADLYRVTSPALMVNDTDWLRAAPTVLVNGRWLPPARPAPPPDLGEPCVAMVGDEVAYAVVGPDQLADCSADTLDDCLASWRDSLPHHPAGGRLFRYLWEVVQHNGEQIQADWQTIGSPSRGEPADGVRPGLSVVGPRAHLVIHPTAQVDPLVVADTTGGPVVVEPEAVVTAFTRLEGPCFIGPRTRIHGARIRAGTTLAPTAASAARSRPASSTATATRRTTASWVTPTSAPGSTSAPAPRIATCATITARWR
jgi:hypothetical protein